MSVVGVVRLPSILSTFSSSSSPPPPPPLRTTSSSSPPKWVPLHPTKSVPFSSSIYSTNPTTTNFFHLIWPSLAYSYALHFSSGYYNAKIKVEEEEPEEKVVLRFRRAVLKAGVLQECKRRRFFESSQDKKKRKARDAAKRNRKRRPKLVVKARQEVPKKNLVDDEGDNWEFPEGDLP